MSVMGLEEQHWWRQEVALGLSLSRGCPGPGSGGKHPLGATIRTMGHVGQLCPHHSPALGEQGCSQLLLILRKVAQGCRIPGAAPSSG